MEEMRLALFGSPDLSVLLMNLECRRVYLECHVLEIYQICQFRG